MTNLRVKRVWNKKAMQLLTKKETRKIPKATSKQVLTLELNKEKIQENYRLLSARKLQSSAPPLFDRFSSLQRRNLTYQRFLTREMKNYKHLTSLDLRRDGLFQILQSVQTLRNIQDVKIAIPISTLWKYPRFCDHFIGLQSLNLKITKNNKTPTSPEQSRVFQRFIRNLAGLQNLRSALLRIRGVSVGNDSSTVKMILQAFENLDFFGLDYSISNPILQEDYKSIFEKINSLGLLFSSPNETSVPEPPPKELLEKGNQKTLFLFFEKRVSCDLGLVLENSGVLESLSLDAEFLDGVPETFKLPKNLKHLAFKSHKNSEGQGLSRLFPLTSEINALETLSLSASLYDNNFIELSKLPCLWKLKTLKASINCDLGNSKLTFTDVFLQIRQITHLERLDLTISENFMLIEHCLEALISRLVNLKFLRLESSSFRLDREKVHGPLNLPIEKLTHLEELQLVSNNYQFTHDNGLRLLKKIQKMENLKNVIISGVLLAKIDPSSLGKILEQIFLKKELRGTITGPQNIYKKVDTQNMIVQKADRRAQFY